jgi:hypothetical protein
VEKQQAGVDVLRVNAKVRRYFEWAVPGRLPLLLDPDWLTAGLLLASSGLRLFSRSIVAGLTVIVTGTSSGVSKGSCLRPAHPRHGAQVES